MKSNVGKPDRGVRIAAGAAAIIAGFVFQSWWGLIGIIFLLTGLVGWCPLYAAFGLKTTDEGHPQKVNPPQKV